MRRNVLPWKQTNLETEQIRFIERWQTGGVSFVDLCRQFGISPNPPKDTDGRREDSGRGWVRELQGRWPGVLG